MLTNPVYENNAIDLMAFGVVLRNPLNTAIFSGSEELSRVRSLIGDEFVEGALVEEVEVGENDTPQSSRIVGFEFRTITDETLGSWVWSVKVSDNTIALICKRFSSWQEVWDKAEFLFKAIFEAFSISTVEIVEVGLQLIDRFDLSDISAYDKNDVFNIDSDYFSRKVLNSESSWHLHQGWFENIPAHEAFVLHNLNLNTAVNENLHVTRIGHVMKVRAFEREQLYSNTEQLFSRSNGLPSLASDLYRLNKNLMREILSDSMKEKTGLGRHE